MDQLDVTILAGVVYSAGKVFDGLQTGRLDTESFLRSGSTKGIASKADLALLLDLRAASEFILEHSRRLRETVDAEFVRSVNRQLTESAAINPGKFRTDDQNIGVNTPHGPHTPRQLDHAGLQRIVDEAQGDDAIDTALNLFVALAKAQPFEDGNKRTALFSANGVLLASQSGFVLTVPVDEKDPSVAEQFNDLLARAYIFDEYEGVKSLLRERGLVTLNPSVRPEAQAQERFAALSDHVVQLKANADDNEARISVVHDDGRTETVTELQYWTPVEDNHRRIAEIGRAEVAEGRASEAEQTYREGTEIIRAQIESGLTTQRERGHPEL